MFERHRSKKDFPPKKDDAQEEGVAERAEKPAPLKIAQLVEKAKGGNTASVAENVLAYIEGWKEYATSNDIFFSKDVAAMRKAEPEIIRLADEVAKIRGNYESPLPDQLRSKLEELAGPLSENIENAVVANKARLEAFANGSSPDADSTRAEKEKKLTEAVQGLSEAQESSNEEKTDPAEPAPPKAQSLVQKEEPYSASEVEPPKEVGMPRYSEFAVEAQREALEKKEAMRVAEERYLAEYKEHYAQKGSTQKNESEYLEQLKASYDLSRVEYGNALTKFAMQRTADKNPDQTGPSERDRKLIERYNRLVRYKEIVKPTAEKMYQARVEGMGEREKGFFGKALTWAAGQNKKIEEKWGKNTARLARAVAVTAVIGGGAAAAGAFGTAGLLGAVGWGTTRVLRTLASTAIGGAAGESLAQLYGRTLGKRGVEKAQETLATTGRSAKKEGEEWDTYTGMVDIDELQKADEIRLKSQKEIDPATLEKRKMIVRAVTAAGVGAGMAGFFAEFPSAEAAPEEMIEKGLDPVSPGELPPEAAAPSELSTADTPAAPVETAPESEGVETSLPNPASSVSDTASGSPEQLPAEDPTASAGQASETGVEATPTGSISPASPEVAANSAPANASAGEYASPIDKVIPLPEGMDPDSPEATAFLNKAYNPEVFAETPEPSPSAPVESVQGEALEQQIPSPASGAEAAAVPDEPLESPSTESVPPAEAAPEPQAAAEATPSAAESTAGAEAAAPVQSTAVESVVTPDTSSGPTELIEQPIGSGFEKGVTLESLEPDQYVNKSGVTILPKEPHVYELDKPKGMRVLWGGTAEEQMKIIEQYLQESADQQRIGVPINVFFPDADGKPILISYALDKDGNTVSTAATNGLLRRPVEFAGTDSFRAKID